MGSFWQGLERPIVGLAPMDGVTDAPMRFITAKYGKPDVVYTEFVSADGLVKAKDKSKLLRMLEFDEMERPIVAQLFGADPSMFYQAAKMVVKLGFDGVDVNMGCPAKSVAERGAGAGLIKNPKLAGEIVEAVRRGVNSTRPGLVGISVKTRIGFDEPYMEWIEFLCGQKIDALAVHGRSFKQGYKGKADWEALAEASKIAHKAGVIFLGNGDVKNRQDGEDKCNKYGTDGVLIGRAAMGNPLIFCQGKKNDKDQVLNFKKKLKIMLEHGKKFEELCPDSKFLPMRKHLAAYCKGFAGAKKMRIKLVGCGSSSMVRRIVSKFGIFDLHYGS